MNIDPKAFFEKQLNLPKNTKTIETTKLDELYWKPKKEKVIPHFQPESPNYEEQMDILYLPNDNGFQYYLVCIDQGSRLIDCVALKDKSSKSVLKALATMYERKIIGKPKTIRVDAGTEFKGDLKKGLDEMGIQLIVAKSGRHRALGLVERKNFTIGSIFHKLMAQNQLAGYISSKWVSYLPDLVSAINQKTKLVNEKKKKQKDVPVEVAKNSKITLFHNGDQVRIKLDNPESIDGKRLHGTKFRASDIKWSPQVYAITGVMIEPNEPIMYATNADHHYRTFEQLLPTKQQENPTEKEAPVGEVEENRFEVEKLLERKIENGETYFLVKWRHLPKKKATWENRKELLPSIPQMVNKFDKKHP